MSNSRRWQDGRAAAAASMVVLLGACAGQDARPARPVSGITIPAHWASAGDASAAMDIRAWWTQFGDAELNRLMTEALVAAPDLKSAQAALRQARASRDLAAANLWPSLGITAAATRSRTGRDAGGSDTAQTRYNAGFDASWEVPLGGGLRDAASGAAADAAAASARLEAAQVSLAAELALHYIGLRAYQHRLQIAHANAASQEETLHITEWRAQAGLAAALDVEQARASLEQNRAAIPSLENGRAEAVHRLAVLTGQPPGVLHARLAPVQPLPVPPEAIAVGIPADTLRRRPDIRAAEWTLRAELARTAERAADREPRLNLSGTLGWQAFKASALGGSGSLARSLAASLAATLFDGGRIRARFIVQDAVREQALIAYEKAILSALEEAENALTAYAAGRERVTARRRAATAAGNAALLARTQYRAGLVDFQKVLDTERTQLSTEDALAVAEGEVLTATISLYKALGGGWQAVPEEVKENP